MIVRWGLGALVGILDEIGAAAAFLLASERWSAIELPVEFGGRWSDVPTDRIDEIAGAAEGTDALVALGGGSTIDTAKAASAATGLPVVSIPTTYSGAEWTRFFGVRDAGRRMRGGGAGAKVAGIVYEPELTLALPRDVSGGTALNALAHCAEALYVAGRNDDGDRHALAGARLIAEWLPAVLADGSNLKARTRLLEGAAEAGAALASAGLGLGHAMAQALGGRYGLPHGALNAICLPAALRFNEPAAPDAIARLGSAVGGEAAARVEELARLAGFTNLRDLGVPWEELDAVAAVTAGRAGAKANPRPAAPEEIAELLRSVW